MVRWEYLIRPMGDAADPEWNALGAEGWEVVGWHSDRGVDWLFKRPLTQAGHSVTVDQIIALQNQDVSQ